MEVNIIFVSFVCYLMSTLSESTILKRKIDSCSLFNGKTLQHGEFTFSEEDPCERCFCRKGTLRCRVRQCPPLNCPNPSIRPKKCCPICRKLKHTVGPNLAETLPAVTSPEASSISTQTVIIRLLPPPITPPPPPSESNNSVIIVKEAETTPIPDYITPIVPPPPMPPTPPATIIRNRNSTEQDTDTEDSELPSDGVCKIKCKKGDIGDPGLHGTPGIRGPPGQIGPQGSSGISGEQGIRGEKGERGSIGSRGKKGGTGSIGQTGLPGVDGLPGPPGPQGPMGYGEKGETGESGPQGPTGLEGNIGPVGPSGPEGPKGEPGETTVQGQIIIVPNESAMNRIQTEAAIAYRMDDKKLYYRDDSSWNCLIAEDTLEEVKQNLIGPPGPQGIPGPRGAKGDKGDIGIMGDDGTIIQESECGNGIIELHEQCDDGNDDSHDECIACRRAYCGDGYRRRDAEECDGRDFNDQTCQTAFPNLDTIGFLRCTNRCNIDISDCIVVSSRKIPAPP